MKSITFLTYPVLLTGILLLGWQGVQAGHSEQHESVENMVIDTLVTTEEAMAILRINPDSAKDKVKHALTLIKDIDAHFEHNTVASLKEKDSTVMASNYQHFYPQVDLQLLSNEQELPTLNYKLESDIVYRGEQTKRDADKDLYFDYTYAKASLVTARDAIDADHALEAMANLRRVFEAIYVNPDFNVSPDNQS